MIKIKLCEKGKFKGKTYLFDMWITEAVHYSRYLEVAIVIV